MPVAGAVKLALRGTIGTVEQTWSIGFWLAGTVVAPTLADLQAFANGVLTPASVWMTTHENHWSTMTQFNGITAYFYPLVPGPSTLIANAEADDPVVGRAVTYLPGDVALVYSLRTGVAGRSNRGRVYVPWTSALAVQANGQLDAGTTNALPASCATFIDAVNSQAVEASLGIVSVLSQTHATSRAITQVVVDSKLDTQRRRQDKNAATTTASANV